MADNPLWQLDVCQIMPASVTHIYLTVQAGGGHRIFTRGGGVTIFYPNIVLNIPPNRIRMVGHFEPCLCLALPIGQELLFFRLKLKVWLRQYQIGIFKKIKAVLLWWEHNPISIIFGSQGTICPPPRLSDELYVLLGVLLFLQSIIVLSLFSPGGAWGPGSTLSCPGCPADSSSCSAFHWSFISYILSLFSSGPGLQVLVERGDPEVRCPVLGVRRTLRPARRPLPRPTLHGRIQVDHHVDHY